MAMWAYDLVELLLEFLVSRVRLVKNISAAKVFPGVHPFCDIEELKNDGTRLDIRT